MPALEVVIRRLRLFSGSIAGELRVNRRRICHTLELPEPGGGERLSFVPNGRYAGTMRYDKANGWRIRLSGVPGQCEVRIHLGNYARHTPGCVLVGTSQAANSVMGQAAACRMLKQAFYGSGDPSCCPVKEIMLSFTGVVAAREGDAPGVKDGGEPNGE